MTWGGENNPMDDPVIRQRQKDGVNANKNHKEQSRQAMLKFNQSAARKELDKRTSERQKGIYAPQFEAWNTSRMVPVAIIDENGNELIKFESCVDAIHYLQEVENLSVTKSSSGTIIRYADKFNKNGKRKKFCGHYWHKL